MIRYTFATLVACYAATNGFLLVPGVDHLQQPCRSQGTIHCFPGEDCWPLQSDIAKFKESLDGHLMMPDDKIYGNITIMKNTRVTKYPAMIVVAKSVDDVLASVKFARERSIRLVVQSSGHDYQGRSTADGALMVYLGNMTDFQINLKSQRSDCPFGEMTIESGKAWKDVYLELDKVDRVIIGGSALTVAIGGYTLGGGHSPISRMYGMAVDNLLEVEMVTADAKFVIANASGTYTKEQDGSFSRSPNADLFWALRGGGGGTFGIATRFRFRLHEAPKEMVTFSCNFPMYVNGVSVALAVLEQFGTILPNMPKQWGGYFMMSILPYEKTPLVGSLSFYFNHFGGWSSPSRAYMDHLKNFRPDLQRFCSYQNKTSFWDYEKGSNDPLYYRNYVTNTLLQKESFNQSLGEFLVKHITYPKTGCLTGLTGTLLGGTMMNVSTSATAVHPGFRSALMSLTFGASWEGDGSTDQEFATYVEGLDKEFKHMGDGSYPNESNGKSPTWKSDFWGSNYARLEQLKHTWDPENFFMCRQCVGWDHWKN